MPFETEWMQPEEPMSEDDFCVRCAAERRAEGLMPNILVASSQRTFHLGLEVKVCPTCDGGATDLILKMR